MTRLMTATVARILALALLATVLSGCSSPPGQGPNPDPETLRTYAQEYVLLLEAKDEAALRQHLANEAHPSDAAARIAAFGGGGWTLTDVSWTSLTPRVFALSMEVSDPDGETTWRYNVSWTGGHWIMAPLNGSGGGAATISPT